MAPKTVRIALMLSLVVLAFVAGLALGNRTTFGWTMGMLTAETHFNLSNRVETLARLRTGDADGAIALLEQAVDTATESLPQGKPWTELEPTLQSTLQLAKAYRQRYPPQRPSPALAELLETIPMPDARYCSVAMQELLKSPTARD